MNWEQMAAAAKARVAAWVVRSAAQHKRALRKSFAASRARIEATRRDE